MAQRLRFYSDEQISKAVINGLRQRGVDVLTTPEAAKMGSTDLEHLIYARDNQRVIITQDADFLRLHAKEIDHAGIVYSPTQTPPGDVIRGIILICEVLSVDEMKNHIEFI